MQRFIHSVLPHKLISQIAHFVAGCKIKFIKNFMIKIFIKCYKINLKDAESKDINYYSSFNKFFIRKLKPSAINFSTNNNEIDSPVEGGVAEYGIIKETKIIQAKNINYDLKTLLGNVESFNTFVNGEFATLYLAPYNYHRVHMPVSGTLEEMIYIPGRLFPVKKSVVQTLPGLFTRNERVVAVFNTEFGKMAMVLVGAMVVGSIETSWHGVVTPPHNKKIMRIRYPQNFADKQIKLEKGKEMGLFKMGSTVILLFEKDKMKWLSSLERGQKIVLGESLGNFN